MTSRVRRWAESALAVRPEGARGALALAVGLAGRLWGERVPSRPPAALGRWLGRPVVVRVEGGRMFVRPGTGDLKWADPGRQGPVGRWFRPGRGDRVVHVGAHLGLLTVRAGRAGARVLAFEPNPALAERLEANLRLNGLDRVPVLRTAVGPRSGRAVLFVPGPGPAGGRVELPVPVTALDPVLADRGFGGRIEWLVLEAEGSEAQILEGAARTLGRTDRVLLAVVKGPHEDACRTLLARAGLIVVERARAGPETEAWRAERDPTAILPEMPRGPSGFAG
jgi:FkbM family methyltransferase